MSQAAAATWNLLFLPRKRIGSRALLQCHHRIDHIGKSAIWDTHNLSYIPIHSILYIYSLKNFVRNPKNLFFVTPTSHLFSNHDNNQHWILRRVRLQTTLGQAFKNTGHHVQSILREQNTNYHLRSWTNWLLWSNSNNCCWGSNYSPLKTWWCRSYKRRVNTRFVGVRS